MVWEQKTIYPTSVYKLSKVEEKAPSFEEKFGKDWNPVAKTNQKEMASRGASKYPGNGTAIGILAGDKNG